MIKSKNKTELKKRTSKSEVLGLDLKNTDHLNWRKADGTDEIPDLIKLSGHAESLLLLWLDPLFAATETSNTN